ncbi:VWA domain-containing protein [Alteromonas sp. KC3]|uniref:vWA domain-containing protein n=1 Tax=unclassified Alteromonas TaxID=2614992 RepID=UPI0019210479|nr:MULTISPECIES: VWA domain-containing protein [unclassified Alteromonas]BCO18995.1 VWA domain-containing protein [Alteromonas sp. KC3]BCO22953.1 VWA domain-containing protein [Alteromonas sp. KC14]
MLIQFFFTLRKYQVKTTLRELLDLLRALEKHVVYADIESFYSLARTIMVKDETQYDKFDRAFAEYFEGVESVDLFGKDIPEEWLRKEIEKNLSPEEREALRKAGGLDALMETLKKRLEEQEKRHQGGNKWVGTGGTSPFGAYGDNPEGVRIGQKGNRKFSAVKVWDKREFKNLSSDVELGTRNIKIALRKLRKFARTGASEQLDVPTTIGETAKKGGLLDIHMAPERHNAVKVLMFFDVGGSMDPHVKSTQELFSAVQSEFKYLEYFYFHNCVYEEVWKDNLRRNKERIPIWDIIHRYGKDYKVIFVGDATMGPYEITYPGGSVEHWNEEPGSVWLQRLLNHFNNAVWLNPQAENYWPYYSSIKIIREIMEDRMYGLTLEGLTDAIKGLSRSR